MNMDRLTAAFHRAVIFLRPARVVVRVDDVAKIIGLTGPDYHRDSKAHLFVMNACGMVPSVRNDNGFVRSFYADPRLTIPTRPAEPDEEPPPIRSSAAIMAHDWDKTRWSRGLNIVVRGPLHTEDDPCIYMAMRSKYDKKTGAMTVQRLYMPVFNGQRVIGHERIAVTDDTVMAALKYMVLCYRQMKDDPHIAVTPWHNYRDTFGAPPRLAHRP